MQKNAGSRFVCRPVGLRVETTASVLTRSATVGDVLRIPVNHFEGNYVCDAGTLARLRAEDRVVLRYMDNPNGSLDDIAGIANDAGNVVGLMPHPERAAEAILGGEDGAVLLQGFLGTPTLAARA